MILGAILSLTAAAFAVYQCGPFLPSANDGWARINDFKPTSQKINFLKQEEDYDNIKMQWMVPCSDCPHWYGMDYIKRNGKTILNAEDIRSNVDLLGIFGTFDCVKMK